MSSNLRTPATPDALINKFFVTIYSSRLPAGFQRPNGKTAEGRRRLRRFLRLRPRGRRGRETHPCGTPNEYRVPRGFSVVPTHRGTENVRKRTVIVRNRDAHPIRAVRKLHVSFRPDNGIPVQEPRPKASPCEYKRFMITPK